MKLKEIAHLLECDVLCGNEYLNTDIRECFAADMMSDVLAFSRSHTLLITALTSVQSVHTADLADFKAILYVHGKRPSPPALELAVKKNLPVLTTRHHMFDACGLLFREGLIGAEITGK